MKLLCMITLSMALVGCANFSCKSGKSCDKNSKSCSLKDKSCCKKKEMKACCKKKDSDCKDGNCKLDKK